MSDVQANRLVEHEELRDIHRRIDMLKEEQESNHRELTSKLHNLEVAVAHGSRFPPAAGVAAAGLILSIVGTGAVLYSQLMVTQRTAEEAATAIRAHVTQMGPAERTVWTLDERVKSLESRIVGQGPNGWHRSDHESYAAAVDARFKLVEERQETICARVAACKGQR